MFGHDGCGHEDRGDSGGRLMGAELREDISARHVGQGEVKDNQIRLLQRNLRERRSAGAAMGDVKATNLFQGHLGQDGNIWVVFDKQDAPEGPDQPAAALARGWFKVSLKRFWPMVRFKHLTLREARGQIRQEPTRCLRCALSVRVEVKRICPGRVARVAAVSMNKIG
jgi:hypothetical protein